ncbi:hypothetical protein L4D09_08850 [Photobacterium makurazakiensis]|uniref:hypothetical protein n=1 Tax=Photobacterium TaxID=657 RepID=UPI003D0E81B4
MNKLILLSAVVFSFSSQAFELQGREDNYHISEQNVKYIKSDYKPSFNDIQGQRETTDFPKLDPKYTPSNYKPSFDDIKGRS